MAPTPLGMPCPEPLRAWERRYGLLTPDRSSDDSGPTPTETSRSSARCAPTSTAGCPPPKPPASRACRPPSPRSSWGLRAPWQPTCERRWPSAAEAWARFGRWSALVHAAGDRPNHRRWTRAEVSAALLTLAAELRHTPRTRDLIRRPDMPSQHSVARQFGTFRQALKANGLSRPRPANRGR